MSHLALYRKYRPGSFPEVSGQDEVVKVLEGAIKAGTITHAYLFAGSRGTGKTSVARILAAAIGTSDKDLYEIDAASSRGIDEIRELREGVRSLPFDSKYKVYIIDEVHMLTKEAFNALLKTLEEPPAHAIFILATTDAHKVPETILSRCQVFTFRKPSVEILESRIKVVAEAEGITLAAGAANLIALAGDGSFRDALGVLQKIATAEKKGKDISRATIEKIIGTPPVELVEKFIHALVAADAAMALPLISELTAEGKDVAFFLKLTLATVRRAMLAHFAPTLQAQIKAEVGEKEFVFLASLAAEGKAARLPLVLRELLTAAEEIIRSPVPELCLELAVIRLTLADKN